MIEYTKLTRAEILLERKSAMDELWQTVFLSQIENDLDKKEILFDTVLNMAAFVDYMDALSNCKLRAKLTERFLRKLCGFVNQIN